MTDDRNGVRIGQAVRDLDGRPLGRVDALYEWGFRVVKGFPILFRQEQVLRYDEVRGERDGALVVARSEAALLQLAGGEIPDIWRVPTPHAFPAAATPSEARDLFAELAGARAASAAPRPGVPEPQVLPAADERDYVRSRGESFPAGPPPQP
ncbi:conserved hypothetical protein [Anaeromyxobacter sp. K]|uniref:hypothetical protein n=1 Tax=Anaeromyxobacter sp. (strain K) TaxID=447217 RepID=UPI00015F9302|nr:hypothetical protein [Anaeromyxobacter sp. K]ACG75110.1 conserved hypothetical protein [Anaeromyxobacter sp. K]